MSEKEKKSCYVRRSPHKIIQVRKKMENFSERTSYAHASTLTCYRIFFERDFLSFAAAESCW